MSVISQKPAELLLSDLRSADDHIIARRQVEVIPRQQNRFGEASNATLFSNSNLSKKLTFYVSDSRGFLDGPNSYITGEFQALVLDSNDVPIPAFLDEGGIHSCISEVVVRSGNAILERIEDYSKLYNMMRFATIGEEHVDTVEWQALDSSADVRELIPKNHYDCSVPTVVDIGATTLSYAANGTVTITAGVAEIRDVLKVGDKLILVTSTMEELTTYVTEVTGALTFVISPGPLLAVADGAHRLYKINDVPKYERESMRYMAVNNTSSPSNNNVVDKEPTLMRFNMKLMLKFLSHAKYIALPLLPAPLEIEIQFNPARLCLVECSEDPTVNAKFGYSINNPRFMAAIVEIDDLTMSEYIEAYESAGITYPYNTFRRYLNRLDANTASAQFTFQTNVISARNVFTVLCEESSTETNVEAAQNVKSQSTFLKSGLKRYRYNSGALRFPHSREVQTDDFVGSEAFAQLNMAVNHHSNTLHDTMIDVHSWAEGNYYDELGVDDLLGKKQKVATKFIISAPLAKHGSSFLTGVDLSTQFLQIDISKEAMDLDMVGVPPLQVKTFIQIDSSVNLSRSNGALVKF